MKNTFSLTALLLCVFPGQSLLVYNVTTYVTNRNDFEVHTTMSMTLESEDSVGYNITYENVDVELTYLANTSLDFKNDSLN